MSRSPAVVALALLATLGGAGCRRQAAPARNVLLISIDSLRADHLGCYGSARDTSPRLDALAAGGTRFAHVYAPSSWTLPSHATLLTGVSQRRHGAVTPRRRIAAGLPTLATRLGAAGFRTRGVHSGPFLGAVYGFDRGFETYESCQSHGEETGLVANLRSHSDETNPCLRKTFTRWVTEAKANERHFWFVHMWDPHYDYIPPARYVRRFDPDYHGRLDGRRIWREGFPKTASQRDIAHLLARYDGEIRYTDDTIAAMLQDLERAGLLADTLVVVTADHGDEFREHGGKGHYKTVFAEVLAVPLILAGPGVPRGRVVDAPVGLADVAPTILALAGVPGAEMDGESLVGRMRGEAGTPRPVVSVLYDPGTRSKPVPPPKAMSIRLPDVILVRPGRGQPWVAFDPVRDPLEQVPLPVRDPALLQQADDALASAALPKDQAASASEGVPLSEHLEEQLRDLGYLE
jgi:arylsulfatase A-like enzyme